MSRLHELAQRLGVEITHSDKIVMAQNTKNAVAMNVHCRRPDKDIAHDMLGKLSSARYELAWENDEHGAPHWYLMDLDMCDCTKHAAFEEAICTLAEKHLEQKRD